MYVNQIGLGDCLERTWEVTDSFFGGSHGVPNDERCRINRAYARVSRDKMQAKLKARLAAAGVTKIRARVDAKTVCFSFSFFVSFKSYGDWVVYSTVQCSTALVLLMRKSMLYCTDNC